MRNFAKRIGTSSAAMLCIVSVAHTADAQARWPYSSRATAVPIPPHNSGEFEAKIIGLPLLTAVTLPAGYREYRFTVDCGLCLPQYVIRLMISPNGKISGNAYLIWFGYDSSAVADTNERTRRMRLMNDAPNNCASKLQKSNAVEPGFPDYRWCVARRSKSETWTSLTARLEALGILQLPTADGYAPEPPNFGVDTVRLKDRTVLAPRRDCGDIASPSLSIFALIGPEYRAADFWCLETKSLENPEHTRVARAYELLHDAIEAYRDPDLVKK